MPNFFIDRPIFAGDRHYHHAGRGLLILKLPVAQYPTIAPPAVTISATYPGADAKKRCRIPLRRLSNRT